MIGISRHFGLKRLALMFLSRFLSKSSTTEVVASGYRAFISYSHADIGRAKKLHRQLESYRVPSRLVGRVTRSGRIGKSIGKLFRDRDDLSVSSDLTGRINLALKSSQFLIVLCSTDSAKSKWVNQEIANFKRLKGPESIIAVILNGEPYASNIAGREMEECFPPSLRFEVDADGQLSDQPAEPIAADLRPGKDGERLVRMKVLAGLLGVELDELIRREVQRRNRQLFALTCAMGAVVAALTVLSITAVIARNDARRQRDQAEGLIDFMLGDLRDKLKPVGRLDSLDAVGERAARYFESLKPDEIDAESQARLARAKLLSGEVLYSQGRTEAASDAFRQAYAMTLALYEAHPSNAGRMFDHAQSEYWVGYGHYRNARYGEAETYFIAYRDISNRLVELDRANLVWQAEVASAFTNLGAVHSKQLRYKEAADELGIASRTQSQVIAQQPPAASFTGTAQDRQRAKVVDLNLTLGQILAWEADAELGAGRISEALTLREKELEIYRNIEELDPKNASLQQAHWVALAGHGTLLLEKGEAGAALMDFRAAIRIAETLTRLDPENRRWSQLLGRAYLNAADALVDLNNPRDAREYIDLALARGRQLITTANINRSVRTELLGRALLASANLHFEQREYENSRSELSELLPFLNKALEAAPDDPVGSLLKIDAYVLAGNLESMKGRRVEAATYWETAVEHAEKIGVESSARVRVSAAIAWKKLGSERASGLITTICAQGYRRSEFKQFCR